MEPGKPPPGLHSRLKKEMVTRLRNSYPELSAAFQRQTSNCQRRRCTHISRHPPLVCQSVSKCRQRGVTTLCSPSTTWRTAIFRWLRDISPWSVLPRLCSELPVASRIRSPPHSSRLRQNRRCLSPHICTDPRPVSWRWQLSTVRLHLQSEQANFRRLWTIWLPEWESQSRDIWAEWRSCFPRQKSGLSRGRCEGRLRLKSRNKVDKRGNVDNDQSPVARFRVINFTWTEQNSNRNYSRVLFEL